MKLSGIYKIQSIIKPDRIYVGSAVNIDKRWSQHLTYLKQNKHHTSKLQRHYNKYGKDDLKFSVIILCERNDLLNTEQYYLDSINPFFNTCKIAGNTSGFKASKETKAKLRLICKGNKGRKGIPLTENHKEKIRQSQMGENNSFYHKHHSKESKKMIAESNKLRYLKAI